MSTEKTEASYQQGTVPLVQGQEVQPGTYQPTQKQGHMCCGGCCDMRRAVIIANIVNICFVLIALFGVLATKNASNNADQFDDDEVKAAMGKLSKLPIESMIAILVIMIVFSLIGIFGAIHFNIWLTGASGVWYAFNCFMALVSLNIGGVLYYGLFVYPHFFFNSEVNKGIMTKENYPNEEQSCCCV